MLVTKELKNIEHVLPSNRVKFPKDFFAIVFFIPTWPPLRHVKTLHKVSIEAHYGCLMEYHMICN